MTDHPRSTSAADDALVTAILGALGALELVRRSSGPEALQQAAAQAATVIEPVRQALVAFRSATDAHGDTFHTLDIAAKHVIEAADSLAEAISAGARVSVGRALRPTIRAMEALYPLASSFPSIDQYFTAPQQQVFDDAVRAPNREPVVAGTGLTHFENALDTRGGYSLYVPEDCDPSIAVPLVVALHGGSGHGADFLWTWLRDARSAGAILVAPTSRGQTWSLREPEVDARRIDEIADQVRARWTIDPGRMLLTGMSDGGTFALLSGLREGSPFTHLAPCSAAMGPDPIERASAKRLAGLQVYLMHGLLDPMFPVSFARLANILLTSRGANIVYREIADLGHAYPREENARILAWLDTTAVT